MEYYKYYEKKVDKSGIIDDLKKANTYLQTLLDFIDNIKITIQNNSIDNQEKITNDLLIYYDGLLNIKTEIDNKITTIINNAHNLDELYTSYKNKLGHIIIDNNEKTTRYFQVRIDKTTGLIQYKTETTRKQTLLEKIFGIGVAGEDISNWKTINEMKTK